jgi:hypothetical protein
MNTRHPVDTEDPHAPQGSTLEEVEPAPTPYDLRLVSPGATALPPGARGILDGVLPVRDSLTVSGRITFNGRLNNPPTALLFRSDTPQGPFVRVVSRPIAVPPDGGGDFTVRIDRTTDPGLFPGFFIFGIRNPKGNAQAIVVTITRVLIDGKPV